MIAVEKSDGDLHFLQNPQFLFELLVYFQLVLQFRNSIIFWIHELFLSCDNPY